MTEAFHEAGYDSLLTAIIMLRLAAKLGAEHKEQHTEPQPQFSPEKTSLGAAKAAFTASRESVYKKPKVDRATLLPPAEQPQQTSIKAQSTNKPRQKGKKKNKNKNKNNKPKEVGNQPLQTKNIFDCLDELSLNPETDMESFSFEEGHIPRPEGEHTSNGDEEQEEKTGSWEDSEFVQDTAGWVPIEQVRRGSTELIPTFDSDFWVEFGNKLRVFGTQEAVLKVADWKG